MDLTTYIRTLREDLLTAAAIGDEEIRRAAAVLSSAIEPSARLAIMNALSDLAAEVTGALDSATVDLRLEGRDVKVSVTHHQPADADEEPTAPRPPADHDTHDDRHSDQRSEDLRRAMQEAGGELSRTTVRLFNDLKTQAERAASDEGVSLNTYISRAVSESVRSAVPSQLKGKHGKGRPGRDGRNITGFIQA